MTGTIKSIVLDRESGFRRFAFVRSAVNGQRDAFLIRDGMRDPADWETLEEGASVEFEVEEGEKGPRAVDVVVL